MATMRRVAVVVSAFLIASCSLDIDPSDQTSDQNSNNANSNEVFSLAGTWYTNLDDDRYYYDFRPDGSLHHGYYQDLGAHGAGLNGFVTVRGTWDYSNEERSSFSVGWNDSVDRHYRIAEENETGLILERIPDGPAGRGLGSTDLLLRSANTINYTVPEEITELIGKWYYDTTREGRSLEFLGDGTCRYRYFQDYGGNLNGWVTQQGHWHYDSTTQKLTITMNGEVSYHYAIDELSSTALVVSLISENPGTSSAIYTDGQFFK